MALQLKTDFHGLAIIHRARKRGMHTAYLDSLVTDNFDKNLCGEGKGNQVNQKTGP